MTLARAVGGFVLGAVMAYLLPLLALAIALVLGGVLAWLRFRAEATDALGPLAAGYLVAVAAYVVLAVVVAIV